MVKGKQQQQQQQEEERKRKGRGGEGYPNIVGVGAFADVLCGEFVTVDVDGRDLLGGVDGEQTPGEGNEPCTMTAAGKGLGFVHRASFVVSCSRLCTELCVDRVQKKL